MKEKIFEILREVIPNELADYFHIYDEELIKMFVEDIIIDIEDNLD